MIDVLKVAAAMIDDAARCMAKGGHEGDAAARWVSAARGLTFPVTFAECCEVLGVEVPYMRRKLPAYVARLRERNAARIARPDTASVLA